MLTFGGQSRDQGTPRRARNPPGGCSSISLAWEEEARDPPTPVRSSRVKTVPPSSISLAWEEETQSRSGCTPSRTPAASTHAPVVPDRGGARSAAQARRDQWGCPIQLSDDEKDAYDAPACASSSGCPSRAAFHQDREVDGRCEAWREQPYRNPDECRQQLRRSSSNAGVQDSSEASHATDYRFALRTPKGDHGQQPEHGGDRFGHRGGPSSSLSATPTGTRASNTPRGTSKDDFMVGARSSDHGGNITFGQHANRTSSNAFARGADQNCGNFLTDRPTTRVAAPPGGASSVCIGSGHTPRQAKTNRDVTPRMSRCDSDCMQPSACTPRSSKQGHANDAAAAFGQRMQRTSSNAFARGANQNCGNVLTDTPSTRVAAPPGGASSFSIGHGMVPDDASSRSTVQRQRSAVTPKANPSNQSQREMRDERFQALTPPRTPPQTSRGLMAPACDAGASQRGHASRRPSALGSEIDMASDYQQYPDEPRSAWANPVSELREVNNFEAEERSVTPRSRLANHADEASRTPRVCRASVPSESQCTPRSRRASTPVQSNCTPRSTCQGLTPRQSELGNGCDFVKPQMLGRRPSAASTAVSSQSRSHIDQPCDRASDASSSTAVASSFPGERAAGKPALFQQDVLKNLKSRMVRRQSSTSSVTSSAARGSQIYSEDFGFGNFSYHGARPDVKKSASAPRLDAKEEVEGSKPRKWYPAKAPKAPPGGAPTFHTSKDTDSKAGGRKRFSDLGAGQNRDAIALEALRFFQDEDRLGKHAGMRLPSQPTKEARATHRYYLQSDGKAEFAPGRRLSSKASAPSSSGVEQDRPSEAPFQAGEEVPSECDSLPMGADWSTCRDPLPVF